MHSRKLLPLTLSLAALALACSDDSTRDSGTNADEVGNTSIDSGTSNDGESGESGTTTTTGDGDTSTADTSSSSSESTGDGDTGTADTSSSTGDGDTGTADTSTDDTTTTTGEPLTPCEEAELAKSSVGCIYYAIDANNDPAENYDTQPYAVVVSNVGDDMANVEVQVRNGMNWDVVDMSAVMPGTLHQFDLPDRHVNYTNLNPAGAYRIESDRPIIAYQFQPVNGETSFTSDASLLLPTTVYDQFYYVVGWGEPSYGNAQLNIVAAEDDTTISMTPAVNTVAGGQIPAMTANQQYDFPNAFMAGDVIQVEANDMFTGTFITADKPIAVFSTHWCANVPIQTCCCDHLEEQVYGLQTWGETYVAARLPVRNNGTPEPTYWHLFASEDNTTVNFDASPEVTGLPAGPSVLNQGEFLTLTVGGTAANPGDFVATADKPIYMMQYMSSSGQTNVPAAQAGDPAMTQGVPTEQFRDDYVLLVPANWNLDFLVITKPAGATVNVDGNPVAGGDFTAVNGQWEVARIPIADGVHTVDSNQPISVIVVGYDSYDSYAYPAGLDQVVINPQ